MIAAAAEPHAGWGNLIAMIVAVGLFIAFAKIYARLKGIKPLPESATSDKDGVNPQVSDPLTPTSDPLQKGFPEAVGDLDRLVEARIDTHRPIDIIRAAQATLRVSPSTAKRAMRRARAKKESL